MQNREDSPKFTIHIYRLHKDFLYKYAGRVCTVFPCKLLMHQNPSKMRDFLHPSLSHDQNGSLGGAWLAAPTVLSREVMSSTAPLPWRQKLEASDVMGGVDDWWIIVTSCDITPTAIFEATVTQISLCCPFFLSCKEVHFFNRENKYKFNSRSRRGRVGESWKKGE